MALELDTRQRAMLRAMGVPVWLPPSPALADPPSPAPVVPKPARVAPDAPLAPIAQREPPPRPVAPQTLPPARAERPHAPPPDPAPPQGPGDAVGWPALAESVRACRACGLCTTRSQACFAPLADTTPCDWLVVGDPPDDDEDHGGAPFAGASGVLLDQMLRALGLQRANPLPGAAHPVPSAPAQRAYVSLVLKCRAAPGGIPQADEWAHCANHLQREIALVRPRVLLALGRFAIQMLLAQDPALASRPLGRLRGTVHRFQGLPLIVSYHPKALMRNSADKAKAWADLCLAADTLTSSQAHDLS